MKIFMCILFISTVSFFSCKRNEGIISFSFDENLKIRFMENTGGTNKKLRLYCFTETIFPCYNYGIKTSRVVTNDKITINFIQVVKPNICMDAFGPALTLIEIQDLENKSYEIEFNFGSSKILGTLNVSESGFQIVLPTQTKVEIVK